MLLTPCSLVLQSDNPRRHLKFSERSWWRFKSSGKQRRAV